MEVLRGKKRPAFSFACCRIIAVEGDVCRLLLDAARRGWDEVELLEQLALGKGDLPFFVPGESVANRISTYHEEEVLSTISSVGASAALL
jgi:hypothetical protein